MKKTLLYLAALVIGTSSIWVLWSGHVAAATATWDGGGSDNNMNTAQNWTGDVAPSAGDDLVFPAGTARKTITNNYTAGTSFNSITFSGSTSSGETNYTFSGNSIVLVDGVTTDFTSNGGSPTIGLAMQLGGQAFITSQNNNLILTGALNIGSNTVIFDGAGSNTIDGAITGSGTVTKDGSGLLSINAANTSFTGNVVVGTGIVYVKDKDALGTSAGSATVHNGGQLSIVLPQSQRTATISKPLVLQASQYDPGSGDLMGILSVGANCGLSYCSDSDITLSGNLTISTDVRIDTEATARLTGNISGSHTIKLSDGAYGTLVINSSSNGSSTANGSYEAPVASTTYSTADPSKVLNLNKNMTAIVTGTVGTVYLNKLGTLKGTGTVGQVYFSDGILAPGMSPGTLNTGNLSFTGGTLQEELAGTAAGQFDQINVTGTVDLGTSTTLAVSMFNAYKPTVGDSYTIINNDGSDAVAGHFVGLSQGSTFTAGGYLFKISYTGGDGNDVVITAQASPDAPSTGFKMLQQSNPLVSVILLCGVTPLLVLMARRTARVTVK